VRSYLTTNDGDADTMDGGDDNDALFGDQYDSSSNI
jgi:hypothetical protein